MEKDPFKEYIKESEPDKRDKGYAWYTAIGLQAVDGLKTSQYLMHTAVRNIEGEISFEEANALLQSYYEENPACDIGDRTEEADKVSARIAALLSERAFSFTPNEYLSIHRKLFTDIYSHAGRIRDYNITKKEWVLNGDTVLYGSATELRATLDYDLSEERFLTETFLWTRSFITLRYSSQDCGRYTYSKRAIPERRQCSLSSICGPLAFMWQMTFLQRTHGISAMLLSVQTITI